MSHAGSTANTWVQATPGCAFLFFLSQWPGAPDPDRWRRKRAMNLTPSQYKNDQIDLRLITTSMKTLHEWLFALFGVIFSTYAPGQTRIVDQTNEVFYPPSLENIEYFHPMGQEFRPALGSLNFVELMLWDFYGHGYVTGKLAVCIHSGTITGAVLGTSAPLFLPPTFQGVGHFDFSTPVSLTPGATYVIQVDVVSGGDWGVGASGTSSYVSGRKIRSGVPVAGDDLFFREGIMVLSGPSAPPAISCSAPLLLECANGGAIGTVRADVQDTNGNPLDVVWKVDGTLYQTNDIPSGGTITASNLTYMTEFGSGEHLIVVSASNGQTNAATCSTTVTVRDTTPPEILNILAIPNVLWPPNHRMIPVSVTVDAVDTCDPSPVVRITQVTSNEPQNSSAPDWEITGSQSLNVRAERSGRGGRRIYTIVVQCEDASGNASIASVDITVPHSDK